MQRLGLFVMVSFLTTMNLLAYEKNLSFSFDTNSLTIQDVNTEDGSFAYISSDSLKWNTKNQLFKYPVRCFDIEVPQLCNNFKIDINSFILDRIIDLPSPWLKIKDDTSDIFNDEQTTEEYYFTSCEKPFVEIQNEYFDNKLCHHVIIGLYPIMYEVGSDKAWVYNDINLSLSYTDCEISEYDKMININSDILPNSNIVLYDGINQSILFHPHTNSSLISYDEKDFNSELYLVSIWNDELLPTFDFRWNNATHSKWEKSFLVKDAILGKSLDSDNISSENLEIKNASVLNIMAIDNLCISDGIVVSDGTLNFECDNSAVLGAIEIENNGCVQGVAKSISIERGFSMQLGGTIKLQCVK